MRFMGIVDPEFARVFGLVSNLLLRDGSHGCKVQFSVETL